MLSFLLARIQHVYIQVVGGLPLGKGRIIFMLIFKSEDLNYLLILFTIIGKLLAIVYNVFFTINKYIPPL